MRAPIAIVTIAAGFLLSGCANTSAPSGSAGPLGQHSLSQTEKAECRLFERAFTDTEAETGAKRFTIVDGCPGFGPESRPSGLFTAFTESSQLVDAARTALPPNVRDAGQPAIQLFRRLVARGAAPMVAMRLSQSREFDEALAARAAEAAPSPRTNNSNG